jgi:hypothetical protein
MTTKFEDLELNRRYLIKVVKLHTDNEFRRKMFTEGETYEMTAILYDHDEDYNWTVIFGCTKGRGNYCRISEFDAELELIKKI